MERRHFLGLVGAISSMRQPGAVALQAPVPAPGCNRPGDGGGLAGIMPIIVTPEWSADIGKRFDPAEFVRLCRAAHVECVEFYTKNSLGQAMWPYRGRPCPTDWATETRKLAREAGLKFFVFYSVGMDNWMARQHPEWACVNAAGEPMKSYGTQKGGTFVWMCSRSPWRDVVIDEIRQVTKALHPEGLWLDQDGSPNSYGGDFDPALACHCRYCRAAYRDRTGAELPATSDDPAERLAVYRLAADARIEILRDIMRAARQIVPDIAMSCNFAGDFWERLYLPPDFPEVECAVTRNSVEAKTPRDVSLRAKRLWSLGKEFEITCYDSFQTMRPGSVRGTWVDWNVIPASYLDVNAALTSTHGGRFTLGADPLPDGTLYPDEFRNIGDVFSVVHEREPWLAGLHSIPDIGVVYDARSELAARLTRQGSSELASGYGGLYVAPQGSSMIPELTGLHDALQDAGVHFDVVQEGFFAPQDYGVLLIGNAVAPPPRLGEQLRDFVSRGGLLIVTDQTSLRDGDGRLLGDFSWSDLLGVRFSGFSPFEANYAWIDDELRGTALRYPVLFVAPTLKIECTTAQPLATAVYPEAKSTEQTFTWEAPYNYFKQFTKEPMITLNRIGQGSVVYVAAPIGREIAVRDDPWLKHIIVAAVKKYAVGIAAELTGPSGIQIVVGRRPDSVTNVVSLVNRYAGMIPVPAGVPRPQVGPVRVRVALSALGRRPSAVRSIAGVKGVEWHISEDALWIDVQSVDVHGLLVIS
jgi:hypothetical protein